MVEEHKALLKLLESREYVKTITSIGVSAQRGGLQSFWHYIWR